MAATRSIRELLAKPARDPVVTDEVLGWRLIAVQPTLNN